MFLNIYKAAILAALFFLSACGENQTAYYTIAGETMGTTYHITYEGKKPTSLKKEIDKLLLRVNASMSTYEPNSTISKINDNRSVETDAFFRTVFKKAKQINKITEGAFDPTVGPLVNAWGFGFKNGDGVDSATIDSLMQFVGFGDVLLIGEQVVKAKPETIIDFSAIAKGFGVDQVATLLNTKLIDNYMVEIGGEVVVKGKNKEDRNWNLGINKPEEGTNDIFAIASLTNKAVATSGNYRNFKMVDGQKYVHTINPKTGYGKVSKLLSASVIANDCTTADALATGIMVMGVEHAIELDKSQSEFGIYLIYLNAEDQYTTYVSDNIKELIKIAL